ncbi:MAG TPA: preprotein translocase subunit YajC [Candidatus Saccharimonadales bacterium]|jgi:preprotein translocase subunit YajC|nr:preprotein translocase subunit YajC [Candidatus Saccharimonadales bacterium]
MTTHALKFLLADQTVMAANQTGAQIKFFATMVIFMVILWMLMIAPQRKKAKQLEATLKSLKAGDKIVTASGIIGVVISIKDRTVSIRSAETKLEVLKTSVAEVTDRAGETTELKS